MLFQPKMYRKNGLEAFRLLGSDGSEFFYEGAIDCDEKNVFRDAEGRLYYPVLTDIGGAVRYFVELDVNFPMIPFDDSKAREKEISRLINSSPKSAPQLPDDVYVHAEPTEKGEEPATGEPIRGTEPQVPEEPVAVKPMEKIKILTPVPEDASKPWQPKKKKTYLLPLAVGLIILALLSIVAGVYLLKPQTFDGITSAFKSPVTAEPTAVPGEIPTPAPTAEPTAEPTPTNAPASPSLDSILAIQPLIDSDHSAVISFASDHSTQASGSDAVKKAFDVFTYVNGSWNPVVDTGDRKASEILVTMSGDSRDYSVLMCALTRSLGLTSRVIAYYGDDNTPNYYPEVFVANSSAEYDNVKAYLDSKYGMKTPYSHVDGTGYWVSLNRGSVPGKGVESTVEYAIPVSGEMVKIK